MRHRFVETALAMVVAAAAAAACSSSNDCEALNENLCSYDSFVSDKDDAVAASRKEFCTCVKDGPNGLDSDYQKLNCTANREETAALDPEVDADAATLTGCRARNAMLDELKEDFISTCYKTDGTKDCDDSLEACVKDCAESCKADCDVSAGGFDPVKCQDCGDACYGECNRTYPCDEMCG